MRRDEFEQRAKPRVTQVVVFGDVYHLRTMSAGDRARYEAKAFAGGEIVTEAFYPELLCRCLCDEDGSRWYADDESARIKEFDSGLIHSLAREALRLNALDRESVDDAKKN